MKMSVIMKGIIILRNVLDTCVCKSNIGHHVLNYLGDEIGTIIQQAPIESINQYAEYEVPLTLDHDVGLC